MAGYEHGSMDVKAHEKGFSGFVRFVAYVCVVVFFVLVFLAVFNS